MLRLAGLLLVPVLLRAGSLTIDLSVACNSTTLNASSGSLSCQTPSVPGVGVAFANADWFFDQFGNAGVETNANCIPSAGGISTCFQPTSSGHAQIDASYQMTFLGGTGPGFVQPELCVDIHGRAQGAFVTPNGSIASVGGCRSSQIPMVFGVPVDVHLTLSADSFARNGQATDGVQGVLDFLPVLDAQMNPVAATVIVVIPEPSTSRLLMVAMGLFLMGARLVARARRRPIQSAEPLGPRPMRPCRSTRPTWQHCPFNHGQEIPLRFRLCGMDSVITECLEK